MAETSQQKPDSFAFLDDVFAAIALDRYENAATGFLAGLKAILVSQTSISEDEYIYFFANPLLGLVKHKLSVSSPDLSSRETLSKARCSLCGASEENVGQLIGGAEGFICDSCVKTCAEILKTRLNDSI